MPTVSIAAIVLAAGSSRRLGQPKQLVQLNGETLLARVLRVAFEAELSPVFVVISDAKLTIFVEQAHATVAWNPEAPEGIASSIRTGVTHAIQAGASGAVLLTCDQIAVSAEHVKALCVIPDSAAGSLYAGRVGIPAYFPASNFPDLLQLQGDTGARRLLLSARAVQNEGLALDLDTPQDVEKARAVMENQ